MFEYSIKVLRGEARKVSRDMGIATFSLKSDESKLMKSAEMEEIVRDLEDAAELLEDISKQCSGESFESDCRRFDMEEEAFE